jgi:hypothetical protein
LSEDTDVEKHRDEDVLHCGVNRNAWTALSLAHCSATTQLGGLDESSVPHREGLEGYMPQFLCILQIVFFMQSGATLQLSFRIRTNMVINVCGKQK